jgi:lysyl-tRNA synthetase class 2
MLATVRAYFAERDVLEADTHILSTAAPVDAHIDVMIVDMGGGKTGYLHTSPEYGLKKLLANGSGDIYQLGHVFRAEEESPLHSPEFTMLEWYRVGMPFEAFVRETLDLIRLFVGPKNAEILTYKQAFRLFASIDIHEPLGPHAKAFSDDAPNWDRDTQLNLLFSHLVEPHLGKDKLSVIIDWPASQAALAKTHMDADGEMVARRFEVYFGGIELANGFDELTDPVEQRGRFEAENAKRIALAKQALPIDEEFLAALHTLPECCGVAVGFDRLMTILAR